MSDVTYANWMTTIMTVTTNLNHPMRTLFAELMSARAEGNRERVEFPTVFTCRQWTHLVDVYKVLHLGFLKL